jgi:hypothetical protein
LDEFRLGYVRLEGTVGKFCFLFHFILHIAYTVDACALTSILPSLSLIDMTYCTPDTKATPASALVFRLIWISFLYNVLKRVGKSTARYRCAFCSTVDPPYYSARTSILIIRIFLVSYVIRGCFSECLYDLFRFRFYSSLCICFAPMLSSQDTAITVLDRYNMCAGVKSDAGIGSGRHCRLLCSYGFRFSLSIWNLFEMAVRVRTYIS